MLIAKIVRLHKIFIRRAKNRERKREKEGRNSEMSTKIKLRFVEFVQLIYVDYCRTYLESQLISFDNETIQSARFQASI